MIPEPCDEESSGGSVASAPMDSTTATAEKAVSMSSSQNKPPKRERPSWPMKLWKRKSRSLKEQPGLDQQEAKTKLLHKTSRQTLIEMIRAQESTVEMLEERYAEERAQCSRHKNKLADMHKLYQVSQDRKYTLQVKNDQAKEQIKFARAQVQRLAKQVNRLEEENHSLDSRNKQLTKRCAVLCFHHRTWYVPEFPSLCPMDDGMPESDSSIGRYQLLDLLADGHMGFVFAATTHSSNEEFAIKKILKKHLDDYESIKQLDCEVCALQTLCSHDNIVKLKATFHTTEKFYMVFEKAWMDVHEYSIRTILSERDVREIMVGVLKALEFVHSQCFAHMDVKPDNILLIRPESGTITHQNVQLCDFGLCVHNPASQNGVVEVEGGSMRGTKRFFSPEVCVPQVFDAALADVWSAGASLCELMGGFDRNWTNIYNSFVEDKAEEFRDDMYSDMDFYREQFMKRDGSQCYQDLLLNFMLVRPQERLNATTVQNHAWFGYETSA